MTKTLRFLGPAAAFLLLAVDGASAGDGWVGAQNNRARLVWCHPETQDGPASFEAVLEIALDPGWKTYWRVPGDSGVAPDFDFSASANISSAHVLFPRPHRIVDREGTSIGYTGTVAFPVRFEVPDAGKLPTLAVTANYGVCKDICVPVEVKLAAACPAAVADALKATRLAEALVPRPAGKPKPGDPRLVAIAGSVSAPMPKLTITVDFGPGATDADVFAEGPDGTYVPLPDRPAPDARGRATVTIDLGKAPDAKGLAGKPIRLTMASSKGASEAIWVAR